MQNKNKQQKKENFSLYFSSFFPFLCLHSRRVYKGNEHINDSYSFFFEAGFWKPLSLSFSEREKKPRNPPQREPAFPNSFFFFALER